MFYNTEVLTSRKGGFAVFWLAATVGAKGTTAVRKLTKKELLTCNIVNACEKVIQPDEPLALRLSANLLFGISRVFSHKYALYAGDVQHVQQALRKVITDAALTMPDITLGPELPPLAPEEGAVARAPFAARETGIDMQLNPHAVVDMQLDWELGLDWELPGAAPPAAPAGAPFEEEMFVSPVQSIVGSPAPAGRAPAGAYQAREADITLHEPQLHEYLAEGYGGPEAFEPEQLGGPAFGEGEEGLLEGISPELDRAIRAGATARVSSPAAPRPYGVSSSAVGAGADLGGFDEHFIMPEFGGEGYLPEGEETFAERVRREHEEGRARLEGVPRRSPTPLAEADISRELLETEGTPSSTTRKRVSEAIDLAQAKAKEAAPKAKKAKLVPVDRSTELDDSVLKAMRASYADRMQAERDAAERKKLDAEAHQRAMDLVFGPPAFLDAPELAGFWKADVAGQMPTFEGGKAADEKKRRASGLPPTQRPRRPTEVGRGAAGERLSAVPEAGPHEFAEDVFLQPEYGGEPEYGADLGGFEHFHFDEEVEQGRAASAAALTPGRRPSILPWAAEVPTSDVGGPARMAGPSSVAGSRVSMEAPVPGGRTPSLLASPARAESIEGLLAEEGGELVGFEERPFARSPSPQPSPGGAPALEPGLRETESLKFLAYARRQQRFGEQLVFSDIVPRRETNPSTAAQALYHLLCLATKGLVKVAQEDAYGEIVVEMR